ncbi:unnamed protein product [Fraxinus pennsylvanica]|uniref:Uncharacterized protein n=1 Tax=Fraxinus pennsylvanica TaxID=56036 RepID=A0AAD2AF09_9LAMI|nr:unnamed protein product [Fraxinus pennsylvanica]
MPRWQHCLRGQVQQTMTGLYPFSSGSSRVLCPLLELGHSLFFHNLPQETFNFGRGMVARHVYYFLESVYPIMTGWHPLRTPTIIKSSFAVEPVVADWRADVRFAAPPLDDIQQN